MKRYYEAGGSRIGMRQGSTLYWLVSDHLGSTSVTANASGSLYGRLLYKAWGEQRWSSGTTPTTYRYTGQRRESSLGLYYYGARWYDPNLSRWLQPDTIIPGPYNPQDWDRYGYCRNNPIRYIDPTGHYTEEEIFSILGVKKWDEVYALFNKGGKYEGMWGILDILRMANDGDRFLGSFGEFDTNIVGEFRLINGQLYLDKDGNQTLALPILSSGKYDHSALAQYIPFLETWSITATYIYLSSTLYTQRMEFDPTQFDWPGAFLDTAGIVTDIVSLGLAGRFTNASKIAYGAGKVVGPVDLAYGAVQVAQRPSFSAGASLTSDFVGLYIPIIPDIFGLLLNFGNAFHTYP